MCKSISLIKFLTEIFEIDSFEQQCVIAEGSFCTKQLKNTHGCNLCCQSLSKSALYEHKCQENINMLYKTAGKCD